LGKELQEIELQKKKCDQKAGSITLFLENCGAEKRDALDIILNREYKKVMDPLKADEDSNEVKKRLLQSQRDWLKFRDSECRFVESELLGGSAKHLLFLECFNKFTRDRVLRLYDYQHTTLNR